MKKINMFIKIAVLAILVSGSVRAEVEFADGSYSEILALAEKENKIVMIDFVTDWCKWCVETDKKVYTNQEVYSFANQNQINWKIDAEKGEGPELAKKYKVKGFPTIIFTKPDGTEIDRIYGYLPADQFLVRMKEYHSGKNTYGALKAALEASPDDPASNYLYAEKIISNGLDGDVKSNLEKCMKTDPGNSSGYADDAEFLLAYVNEDAKALESVLAKYPESNKAKDAYMNLASFYSASETPDYAKARDMYKTAFARFGNSDPELMQGYGGLLLGEAYAMMKNEKSTSEQRKEALNTLEECLTYVTGSVNEASAYFIMSDLHLQDKEYDKAMMCIDRSISIYDKKSYRDQKEKIAKSKPSN